MDKPGEVNSQSSGGLGALVLGLAELVKRIPTSAEEARARHDGVAAATEKLNSHSVDAASLIRFGFGGVFTGQIVSGVLLGALLKKESEYFAELFDIEQWSELLQLPHEEFTRWLTEDPTSERAEAIQQHISRIVPAVDQWVRYAKIDDLLSLLPPTVSQLEAAKAHPATDEEVVNQYVWAVERCTQSDLRSWSTGSLHLEFRRLNDMELPGTPPALMWDTTIEVDRLNLEIAGRAVEDASERGSSDSSQLLYQIHDHAQTLLRQDRHREASALFDFYAKTHPGDATAINNAAFCHLPVNPEQALFDLRRAEKQGFTPLGVLVHNMATSLSLLNREREALDRME